MIDVFYDAKVGLVCSSQVSIDQLYAAGNLSNDFKRIYSRLHEMKTWEIP